MLEMLCESLAVNTFIEKIMLNIKRNKFELFDILIITNIAFALFLILAPDNIKSYPDSPFYEYFNNIGIKVIYAIVIVLDSLLFIFIILKSIKIIQKPNIRFFIIAICIILSLIIWLEFWYGSTFYYGEVRDKQGLPFGDNNNGIIGSTIFIFYIFYQFNLELKSKYLKYIYYMIILIVLFMIQLGITKLLEESWKLYQS